MPLSLFLIPCEDQAWALVGTTPFFPTPVLTIFLWQGLCYIPGGCQSVVVISASAPFVIYFVA